MTAAKALAKPEPMTMLAQLAAGATSAIVKAKAVKVTSLEVRAKVIDACKALRERCNQVEALKDEIIKPQKKLLEEQTRKFTGPMKDYETAIAALKGAVLAFDRELEVAKAAAALEAAKEAKAGNAEAAHAALMIAAAPPERVAGTYEIKRWTAKVVDPAAVPRAFLVVDESLLVAHAKATNGAAVPGVVFEQVSSLTVRS